MKEDLYSDISNNRHYWKYPICNVFDLESPTIWHYQEESIFDGLLFVLCGLNVPLGSSDGRDKLVDFVRFDPYFYRGTMAKNSN